MGNDDVDRVLGLLPNGARVLSTLLTAQTPPGHVYRVESRSGRILHECSTLVELHAFLSDNTAGLRTDGTA